MKIFSKKDTPETKPEVKEEKPSYRKDIIAGVILVSSTDKDWTIRVVNAQKGNVYRKGNDYVIATLVHIPTFSHEQLKGEKALSPKQMEEAIEQNFISTKRYVEKCLADLDFEGESPITVEDLKQIAV